MKKIIVTGGCGYIGSHVARAFKMDNPNNRVITIDNVKRDHTLKDIDGYFIDDFASDASLGTIIDIEPDVIVHCAGTSLVGPSVKNPAVYYDNNVGKTIRLLNVVKELSNPPTIMFSSSASVYGQPDTLPIRETALVRPISPYGNTKAIAETMFKDYASAYGINSVIFRYFNASGAIPVTHDLGQEPGATHIVARVLEASLKGRAFTINGGDYNTPDGTCIRDYVHVWDIALAHVRALSYVNRQKEIDKTAESHIFNLGTNKGISNKEIADYVSEKYGLSFVNFGPMRAGDPAMLIADAHDARIFLGWEPVNSSLSQIVDSAYKWYTKDTNVSNN